jgi:hypothetical protein
MAKSFKNKPFEERMKTMGDIAEGKCVEWLESEKRGYCQVGLNRPPIKISMIPLRIRHIPDFLTSAGFIECKGFGKDQTLKVKLEDWACWQFWHGEFALDLFFYDSHFDRFRIVGFDEFRMWLCDQRVTLDHFPEMKPYFAVPAEVVFE